MKVMLVCAAGMSSSILMRGIEKSIKKNGLDMEVKAFGVDSVAEHGNEYDIILVAPQIAYRIDKVREKTTKPVVPVNPVDYATANGDNVLKMIQQNI